MCWRQRKCWNRQKDRGLEMGTHRGGEKDEGDEGGRRMSRCFSVASILTSYWCTTCEVIWMQIRLKISISIKRRSEAERQEGRRANRKLGSPCSKNIVSVNSSDIIQRWISSSVGTEGEINWMFIFNQNQFHKWQLWKMFSEWKPFSSPDTWFIFPTRSGKHKASQ